MHTKNCSQRGQIVTSTKIGTILLSIASAASLNGCLGGGGGGGGGGSTATLGAFTKFSAIAPSQSVRIQGSSQEVAYTYDLVNSSVTGMSAPTAFGPTATADVKVDAGGVQTGFAFTSANNTSVAFDTAAGDTLINIGGAVALAATQSGDKVAMTIDPGAGGWDYQTFGVWATGVGTGSGTFGTYSIGSATPAGAVPTIGNATYNGLALGMYANASGTDYFVVSTMAAGVDYSARTISFSTASSQTISSTGVTAANGSLNLSGTLTYVSGSNSFAGNITSVGGGVGNAAMPGTASGYFYGPAAEEIGGGFKVQGAGLASYLGSFGGKK